MKIFKELLYSLNIKQYGSTDIIELIVPPKKEIKESDIKFFSVRKYVTNNELEKEYNSRSLQAIDPYSLTKYYKDNPDRYKFLATQWKDEDGKWCYIAFRRWGDGERCVSVRRGDLVWPDGWWFAGVRKNSELKSLASSDSISFELPIEKIMPKEIVLNGIKYIKNE